MMSIGYGDGLFGSVPFGVAIGKPGLGNIPLEQLRFRDLVNGSS
jgi:hypothetical protein